MFVVLSPAKKLRAPEAELSTTMPVFQSDVAELVNQLQGLTVQGVQKLMSLSENLASLNFERFQTFGNQAEPSGPAALLFNGDTYTGLAADRWDQGDFDFAQVHVGILSGLYGLLSPLDLTEPYRLEMGTRLETARGRSLYDFWGDKISKEINRRLEASGSKAVVNLASKEYFSAVSLKALDARVITPTFKEIRDGKPKIISFMAKKARGLMCDYIVRERIKEIADLSSFSAGGYTFSEALSTPDQPTFIR